MTSRIRYLRPDFFVDEDIAALPPLVRLFYAGLWCHADREGRFGDRPQRLKVEIMPYEPDFDVEAALTLLAQAKKNSRRPFIVRYEVDGQRYIQILSWKRHQKPHHTERPSEIPEPPLENGPIEVKAPLNNRSLTGRNGDFNGDGNGDCDGKGERGKPSPEEITPSAPSRGNGHPAKTPPADHLTQPSIISEETLRELVKTLGPDRLVEELKGSGRPVPAWLLDARTGQGKEA